VLVPALALAAAAFLVGREKSVYRASMGVLVAQAGGSFQPQLGNLALTQTMKNILESQVIAQQVVRQLNLDATPSQLLKKIHVEVQPDSSVLDVSYDSTDKREAVAVLRRLGTAFSALIRHQLGVSGSFKPTGPLRIVASVFNPPHLEPGRVSPKPTKVMAFAGVLGLALGIILAFARESLDDRLRGRREAEEWLGAPVIGRLPKGFRARPRTDGRPQARSSAEDALELLSANVQVRSRALGTVLLVTSARDDDDAAAVVANLGVALARAGQDVVCVETDARRPNLRQLLQGAEDDNASSEGLIAVLEGKVAAAEASRPVSLRASSNGQAPPQGLEGRLMVLPIGSNLHNGGGRPATRFVELVEELSATANYVLFDSPPLLSGGEMVALASAVDGVIVVAREGALTREGAEAARAALDALGVERVAVVLTERRPGRGFLEAAPKAILPA
jgi:capsular polysaccharide biosynthesis protein/MinD-like ATPase involved in chromosome partitioning or flagellar assembly